MIPILALLVAASGTSTATEAEARGSLELDLPEEAWRTRGFRVGTGYVFDAVEGIGGAPSGIFHSVAIRAGARLDEHWSLMLGLRYGVRPATLTRFPAVRYAGTIEPTLHLDDFSFTFGAGIGGFVFSNTGSRTPEPEGGIVAPYTLPTARPLLGSCAGTGVIGVMRVDYTWVINHLLAMGPSLQVDLQWTACTQSLGRADLDTGDPILLKQFWEHHGAGLAWVFWWR